MTKPKVSIIVPIYNVEKYLPCCMDSLLHQTLKDIEIILVDDSSPDHCPVMCEEYAKQDHRVKVIHKQNGGLGYARNSGLEIATGEYIAFVDSDDYVALNTYESLYNIATDTKTDVVYFTFQRFDEKGNTRKGAIISQEVLYHSEEGIRGFMLDMIATGPKAKLDIVIQCSSCCALYRHEVIKSHGLLFKSERELISEDLVFNLDFLLHSAKVITIPDAFYNYRMNNSSLTRTVRSDRIVKGYILYQYLLEMLESNNFGIEGYLRATKFFIGNSRGRIHQYMIQSSLTKREKMQWLKELTSQPYWREIASTYPYRKLPLKHALQFYLLYKGYCHLLYFLETMYQSLNR